MPTAHAPKSPPTPRLHRTPATNARRKPNSDIPPSIRLAADSPVEGDAVFERVVDAHQLLEVLVALAGAARTAAVAAGEACF